MFVEPEAGMFIWARIPGVDDSLTLAERGLRDGFMLVPGHVFRPHLEVTPWMSFNVAVCGEPRVPRWLEKCAAGKRKGD